MSDEWLRFVTTLVEKAFAPILLAYLAYLLGRRIEASKLKGAYSQEVFKRRLAAYEAIGKVMGEDFAALHGLLGAVRGYVGNTDASSDEAYASLNEQYRRTFADLLGRKKDLLSLLPYLDIDIQRALAESVTASFAIKDVLANKPKNLQSLLAALDEAANNLTTQCTETIKAVAASIERATKH